MPRSTPRVALSIAVIRDDRLKNDEIDPVAPNYPRRFTPARRARRRRCVVVIFLARAAGSQPAVRVLHRLSMRPKSAEIRLPCTLQLTITRMWWTPQTQTGGLRDLIVGKPEPAGT